MTRLSVASLRAFVALAILATLVVAASRLSMEASAAEVLITVTSAADDPESDEHECPSDTLCTLRKAIELANADASGEPVRIVFDPEMFPLAAPAQVVVAALLPSVVRAGVSVDATAAGVALIGTALSTGGTFGLHLAGEGDQVLGLTARGFSGVCLLLSGAMTVAGSDVVDGARNVVDDCATGIEAAGAGAHVAGNLVGLSPADPLALVMVAGITVTAADVIVGTAFSAGPANVVGNVATGVLVGKGIEAPFSGVVVRRNRIGAALNAVAAPVGVGVAITHPASGTDVVDNELSNLGTGITVAADTPTHSSTGNTFARNTFGAIAGLAIDLGANGLLEPNDAGDLDSGPNGLLNSPIFFGATQGQISGSSCPGCQVHVYRADHVPGITPDSPTTPLPALDVVAAPSGLFVLVSPPVAPGDWLMATATDPFGNTSEFSASVRIGAGLVQCGSSQLQPGWNLVGYFGESTFLGDDVPPPDVIAVHQFIDGSQGYLSWFTNGAAGLSVVQTGEAYWFYAEQPQHLPGAVSLSSALPVQLQAGWNDFVYVGATATVPDALGSIAGQWDALYTFVNDGSGGSWLSYGDLSTPDYAHAFSEVQACSAYRIRMTENATLFPLSP